MIGLRSSFLRTIQARGYLHQCTDLEGLDTVLVKRGPIVAYIGFDCTADSLHVGSLIQIMLLRHLQQSGHKPIVLMGGSTTQIGDPSGKEEMRQLLPESQIATNMTSLRKVFSGFLRFGSGPSDAIIVDNADWLHSLSHIAFLRDYGRYFSVNRMLGLDSVRMRLERGRPLTFLEFSYIVLQSYDFLELWRRAGCCLQMGGADQWGNIINGIELARKVEGVELFGLTAPLITTIHGHKMGKTAEGAVWLNADRLSPYGYWQFWRNTEDPDVGRFLRLFTELPLDSIAHMESLSGAARNQAKWWLAFEATRLAHGESAARAAAETARKVFEEKTFGQSVPVLKVSAAVLAKDGLGLLDALRQGGLVRSNSEARRLVRSGGVRVNNMVIGDETRRITCKDINDGAVKISAGRKDHVVVFPEETGNNPGI